MEDLTKHYLISGRVQGVGFRAFAQAQAERFHVKGWTRNLADGRVEILAQGSPETLENYEDSLRQGPAQGHVESLTVSTVNTGSPVNAGSLVSPEQFEVRTPFEIRKDGSQPCIVTSSP